MTQGVVQNRFLQLDISPVETLHVTLGFSERLEFPAAWRNRPLAEWNMDSEDVVLRYLFRNFQPNRHLEFGTWEGDGVVRCCEESGATVWTINLLAGEDKPEGGWAYGTDDVSLAQKTGRIERLATYHANWVRTDAYEMIGHRYLERGFGNRVCQIYADSRHWDTSRYPDGFFDSVLVDGGHTPDVVRADTAHAVRLLRPGGMLIWHDFCPLEQAPDISAAARDVADVIAEQQQDIRKSFKTLFWIEPTWMLVGIKSV